MSDDETNAKQLRRMGRYYMVMAVVYLMMAAVCFFTMGRDKVFAATGWFFAAIWVHSIGMDRLAESEKLAEKEVKP